MSLGGFLPNLWGTEEPFTEEEYREALRPRFDPVPDVSTHTLKPHPIEVPDSVHARYLERVRVREHEWTHYRQHISTQLGIFNHRLWAMREFAITQYFRCEVEAGVPYAPIPFQIRLHKLEETAETPESVKRYANLNLWLGADTLDGLLWSKRVRMRDLIKIWEMIVGVGSYVNANLPRVRTQGAALVTRRSQDEQSCPDGHLTVEAVVEGFAKYRELMFLTRLFSPEDAIHTVLPTYQGIYSRAGDFIEERLGIRGLMPLSGALQEVAVLSFCDPFLSQSDVLYWEDIHPGFRLEQAVDLLAHTLKAIPDRPEDVYWEALRAFGLEALPFVNWMSEELPSGAMHASPVPGEQKDLLGETGQRLRKFYRTSFLEAFAFRRRSPYAFFESSLLDREQSTSFASLTRPAFILEPDGVFIPWGLGRDGEIGAVALLGALLATALDDLARDGRLDRFAQLLRKARAIGHRAFPYDFWRDLILRVCGADLSKLVRGGLS